MKNKVLIVFLLVFIGCKKYNQEFFKKEKINKKSIDTIFFDEKGDTVKTQRAFLKNNYKLVIFPTLDKNKKVINFRLVNGKKDNTYLLAETFSTNHMEYYEGIDFQNYFALHGNGGTNHFYFWLYDKQTGNEVLTGVSGSFDLKEELILYTDEDDKYNIYIYDVNTRAKTLLDIPKLFTDKQECTRNDYFEKSAYIKRVTEKYYFISFKDCPSSVEFKVKKQ